MTCVVIKYGSVNPDDPFDEKPTAPFTYVRMECAEDRYMEAADTIRTCTSKFSPTLLSPDDPCYGFLVGSLTALEGLALVNKLEQKGWNCTHEGETMGTEE